MRLLTLVALVLVACGPPPKPGPQANVTYFWKITDSTVAFNSMCSDEPQFRTDNGPVAFAKDEDVNGNGILDPGEDVNMNGRLDGASYVVYKASADATKATLMKCMFLDASSCSPSDRNVVFNVAGTELSFATELKTPSGSGNCNVLDSETWVLTDKATTLDLDISHTLSLVDDQPVCDMLEAAAKARSPNGMGYQGCTITFTLKASAHR